MMGFRGGLVRSIAQQGIAVLILLVSATCAVAQPANNPEAAVGKLRQADSLAGATKRIFQGGRDNASKVTKAEIKNAFQNLRKATQVMLRLAPEAYSRELLSYAQDWSLGVGAPPPSTLLEAADECERRNDLLLASLFASALQSKLASAAEDLQARITLGPIVDNPGFYAQVIVPRNGRELLHNIRFALDHDAVLRRDFYTEQSMSRFFAAPYAPIYHSTDGSIFVNWIVRPTAAELATMNRDAWKTSGCNYTGRLDYIAQDKQKGSFGFYCTFAAPISPSFADVEQAFGKEWRETLECPVHPSIPPVLPPRCNRRITYTLDRPGIGRSLTVVFEGDGTFGSLSLEEEGQR
jgi:hypothetical protein